MQDFGLESEVAKHLSHTYGDRAFSVAKLANMTGKRWPIGTLLAHSTCYWPMGTYLAHRCGIGP